MPINIEEFKRLMQKLMKNKKKLMLNNIERKKNMKY